MTECRIMTAGINNGMSWTSPHHIHRCHVIADGICCGGTKRLAFSAMLNLQKLF